MLSIRVPRLARLEKAFVCLLVLSVLAWLAEKLLQRSVPGQDLVHLALYIVGLLVAFKLLFSGTLHSAVEK